MKSLIFAILMMVGTSLSAMGQTEGDDKEKVVTGYKYSDERDCKYEVNDVGSEFLIYIDDPTIKVKGYCMMDSTTMQRLRDMLAPTTLTTEKEYYLNKETKKKSKTWRARIGTTWGPGEEDHTWIGHYGYLDPEALEDATAMQRTMDLLNTINQMLLERLKAQQAAYGYQRLVCMENSKSGFMYMFVDEDGKIISPKEEFMYFNFGDYCVTETRNNTPKMTIEQKRHDKTTTELIGKTIKVVRYQKPLRQDRLLDAPSSYYTFYFFDGQLIRFNKNYMNNYKGKWIVENIYDLRKLMEGDKKP